MVTKQQRTEQIDAWVRNMPSEDQQRLWQFWSQHTQLRLDNNDSFEQYSRDVACTDHDWETETEWDARHAEPSYVGSPEEQLENEQEMKAVWSELGITQEPKQLNPFPAKPSITPPAHYFARESVPSKSELEPYVPTDAEINTMAEQIVRDRMRKYDEISDSVHYGKAYLDGQYAGHEDGYANRTRWVPVAGYAFVFPDNLPESYVIEEHRAWVDGYADGYDVGAASAIWYREHPDYNGRKGRSQRQTEVDLVVQQMIGTRSTIY